MDDAGPSAQPASGLDLNSAGLGHDAESDEFLDSQGNPLTDTYASHLSGFQVGTIADATTVEDQDGEDEEDYEEYEEDEEEFDPSRLPTFTKK